MRLIKCCSSKFSKTTPLDQLSTLIRLGDFMSKEYGSLVFSVNFQVDICISSHSWKKFENFTRVFFWCISNLFLSYFAATGAGQLKRRALGCALPREVADLWI
jgi:hypothetical protein